MAARLPRETSRASGPVRSLAHFHEESYGPSRRWLDPLAPQAAVQGREHSRLVREWDRYSVGTPSRVIAALKIPNRPSPATSPDATAKLSLFALSGDRLCQTTSTMAPKKITSE